MPGGDRTGPTGKGPLTGRGEGRCVDAAPGTALVPLRRRFGADWGAGGWLAEQLRYMEERIAAIEQQQGQPTSQESNT